MQKVWESLTLFYHFLMRGDWKRIELCSGRPRQAFGIVCRLWITLQYSFQFWNFWWKMQSLFLILSAASEFFALGLGLCLYVEWIRVEIQVHKPLQSMFQYLIFNGIFFNLFHTILMPINGYSFHIECARNI